MKGENKKPMDILNFIYQEIPKSKGSIDKDISISPNEICTLIRKYLEQLIDKTNPDKYWAMLGDIPCDEEYNEYIEEKFLHFEVGTNKNDIWHWFEEYFDICIGDRYF